MNSIKLNVFARFSCLIELCVSEVKSNVNGNLDEVKYVEEEAENEYYNTECGISGRLTESSYLNGFTRDTKCVTDEEEYLKEKALSFCSS